MLAVFSDLHDNLINLQLWAKWCQATGIQTAVFCGDLTNSDTFQQLASLWSGQLYFVQGNADNYAPADVPPRSDFYNLGRHGRFTIDGRTIGVCHEPEYQEIVLHDGAVDVLFYGHTHKPWQEQLNNIWCVNPGTLGGVYYPATFALYDPLNNVWELKNLQQLDK
ncbi:MAG TPA: YfcE family phosphodiesterase [bacterium]|jgi:hypothetical protein|nr:YfcE family phosphodiesterase [bacterium]HOH85680.1 YfcE family phosphodiesterase [bacterium]HPX64292.1 YfcE family phosphodiesterase [bacterium]HQA84326.1 YfcE family phosphodiesterase [bacterium]